MVIFAHPPPIDIHNRADIWGAILNFENLVDLLLIASNHKARAAMIEHIGHLIGHGILIERHRNRTAHLNSNHRPIERRAVAPNDRDLVTFFEAKVQQTTGRRINLGFCLGPAPSLPNAKFFLAISELAPMSRRVARQQGRYRF